ncbi:hypothetical protein, partial [Rhodococcoides fascians]|uniref:hypothetical protein n=1 Tax=Rhodococcoides fascians TaxID=1828 RepID=UPI0012FE12FF
MVTTTTRLLRALILALLVGLSALLIAPTASAQPADSDTSEQAPAAEDSGDDGLFGLCDALPDAVADVPLIGGIGAGTVCTGVAAVADPGAAVGKVTEWAASGAVGEAAQAFLEGFGEAINLMFTWWLNIPLPDLADPASVGAFHGYLYWITASVLAVSIAVSMVRLAFAHAAARSERAYESARLLVRTVFAASTFAPVLVAAHAGSVAMGRWLVDDAARGNIGDVLGNLLDVTQISGELSAGLMFIFGILGIVGALVQAVFVVIQYALIIAVAGFLPFAAAGSGTVAGEQAYKKMLGFALATVLFPLLSGGVYALALWTAGGDDAMSRLCGMALLALSCLCLPVLLRLIMPAVAASGGGSGAAALAGIGVGTGAATGAVMQMTSSQGGGSSSSTTAAQSGGRSPDSPTGAAPTPPSGGGGQAGTSGAAGAAG